MRNRETLFNLERILDLMSNPNMTEKDFCRKWEVSRRTYYRYKAYITDRLYIYMRLKEKILIDNLF